jgi:hypothetical protein
LVSLAALLIAGGLSFLFVGRVAAGQPTPWFGLIERVDVYGYLLWVAVLSVALIRQKA